MKWLGRILYVVMIFFIGMFVLAFNNNKQLAKYYDEYAQIELENNNREAYIEHFMTSKLIKEYIKEPIYLAKSDDSKYPFEIAIYHAKVNISKDEMKDYLILYLNETGIDFKNILEDYESFEKNGNNALMLAKLKIENVEEEFNIPININLKDRSALHLIEVKKDDNKDNIFNVQYRDEDGKTKQAESTRIESINLSILDGTLGTKEDEIIETIFARFVNDKDANMNNNIDSFENDEYIQIKEDKDGNKTEKKHQVLKAKAFNGEVDNYDLSELYKDESNLGKVHEKMLDPFIKKAKNSLYWYALIIVIVTYLIFFLKPTIEYIKHRNVGKDSTNEVSKDKRGSDDFDSFKFKEKEEVKVIDEEKFEPINNETLIDHKTDELIDYNAMTVKELKDLAKERNLTGYSTLNKKDLIEFLKENEN